MQRWKKSMWPLILFFRLENAAWWEMTDFLKVIYHSTLNRKHLTLSHMVDVKINWEYTWTCVLNHKATESKRYWFCPFPLNHTAVATVVQERRESICWGMCVVRAAWKHPSQSERTHLGRQLWFPGRHSVWQGVEAGEGERWKVKWEGMTNQRWK